MTISRVQTEALATLVERLRDDWQRPGILAAITKARDLGTPTAIAAALCRLAENHDLRTPALLAEPGPHWGGTTTAARKPPVMCPQHPTARLWDCAECRAQTVPPPDGFRDLITAEREAAEPLPESRRIS